MASRHYETMGGQAFNLGLSTANLSKLQLCAKIKEHVPAFTYMEAPIGEDPDKRDYIVIYTTSLKVQANPPTGRWTAASTS